MAGRLAAQYLATVVAEMLSRSIGNTVRDRQSNRRYSPEAPDPTEEIDVLPTVDAGKVCLTSD